MHGTSAGTSVNTYRYADIRLSSTIPLDELPAGDAVAAAAIRIVELRDPLPEPPAEAWLQFRSPDAERAALAIARSDAGFVLRFPGLADFMVECEGSTIRCRPGPGCSPGALRHLLLDQVLPRVLAHRHRLVLHAGAVEIGEQAVAFIGASGSGKSTLVAALHAAGRRFVADDGLLVEARGSECTALGLYPGLRLWPASIAALPRRIGRGTPVSPGSPKRRLAARGWRAPSPRPLATLLVLAPWADSGRDARPEIAPLPRRETCVELIRASFQLDPQGPGPAARLLEEVTGVARLVPAFSLSYPHDFSRLSQVCELVLGLAEGARGVPAAAGVEGR
jgi:hypothetical protein